MASKDILPGASVIGLLQIPSRWDLATRFERVDQFRIPVWAWIILLWAILVVPAIGIRSYFFEEGTVVGLARGMIEDGNWLIPHLYGDRLVERPVLMSWLIAGLGFASGTLNQWIARLPAVISSLTGAFLVFHLVRRYASAAAGLFAAMCFFASPIILTKVIVAEPDIMLSVILFAVFIVWWNGYESGGAGVLRWTAIAVLLALAGLVKGPQPLAYFGLGIGAFLLWRRQWLALVGLAAAGAFAGLVIAAWYWLVFQNGDVATWASQSRLTQHVSVGTQITDSARFVAMFVIEMLPPLIVLPLFGKTVTSGDRTAGNELVRALLLYTFCCSVVLAFWPLARVRYAMPAILALATLSGLAFDRYKTNRQWPVNMALLVTGILLLYQTLMSWITMPLYPAPFEQSRIAGQTIQSAMRADPATLYSSSASMDKNILLNVPAPIRAVPLEEILNLSKMPAW